MNFSEHARKTVRIGVMITVISAGILAAGNVIWDTHNLALQNARDVGNMTIRVRDNSIRSIGNRENVIKLGTRLGMYHGEHIHAGEDSDRIE